MGTHDELMVGGVIVRVLSLKHQGGTGIMENRNNRGGMRGPGMGRRPAEKSKDFKGTWMKIIRYCKRYLAVIVVALICAVAGTILTILGQDKSSRLTKTITGHSDR